jgi:hypothetical protein
MNRSRLSGSGRMRDDAEKSDRLIRIRCASAERFKTDDVVERTRSLRV